MQTAVLKVQSLPTTAQRISRRPAAIGGFSCLLLLVLIAWQDDDLFHGLAMGTGVAIAALATVAILLMPPSAGSRWSFVLEIGGSMLILAGLSIQISAGFSPESESAKVASLLAIALGFGTVASVRFTKELDAIMMAVLIAGAVSSVWGAAGWFPVGESFSDTPPLALTAGIGATVGLAGLILAAWEWELGIPQSNPMPWTGFFAALLPLGLVLGVLSIPTGSSGTAVSGLLAGVGSLVYVLAPKHSSEKAVAGNSLLVPDVVVTAILALVVSVWLMRDSGGIYSWTVVGATAVTSISSILWLGANWSMVNRSNSSMKSAHFALVQASETDPLTGLRNRRSIEQRLREEVERARRYGHPLSVAFLDLDDFKQVNDQFGHAVGDDVLRSVGGSITASLRLIDIAGRYGGEEFLIVLPETDSEGAGIALGRVLDRIRIDADAAGLPVEVTASGGIASAAGDQVDPEAMTREADEAMYRAKRSGKNRFEHFAASSF